MPKDILTVELPIQLFSWDTPARKLTAFASDLPKPWLSRVWDDACDIGLKVVGVRETKVFTLAKEEYQNGELVAWNLTEYTKFNEPWKMVVFND